MARQEFRGTEWMDDIHIGLVSLVRMALGDTDSRLYHVLESISQAVWGMDEAVRKITANGSRVPDVEDLRPLCNVVQGKVLTILEAAFESPTQCEALKSLAKQKVWRYYSRTIGADS